MGSTRTGSYHQIKGDLKTEEETAERSYFTCWFDHGAAPEKYLQLCSPSGYDQRRNEATTASLLMWKYLKTLRSCRP